MLIRKGLGIPIKGVSPTYQKLVLITEHQNGWFLFLHVYGCSPLPLRRPNMVWYQGLCFDPSSPGQNLSEAVFIHVLD